MQISKSLTQIEDVFRKVALRILGLPDSDSFSIRFPYTSTIETGSDPDFERTDNVCFIYVLAAEDGYGRQSHISYRDDGAEKLTQIDEHTDVHQVNFVCYGPAAYDWARRLKAGIVKQSIREELGRNQLFYVAGTGTITPVRELMDGAWWNRYDLSTMFYEFVRFEEENSVGIIEDIHITQITERSP